VLVEWQGAQRWCWAPLDQAAAIRATARAAGGHASLFRAPATGAAGVAREDAAEPAIAAIQARLRAEFDPAGIFSPHAG
jgi:glycolate oxidase FAD binding subunit